MSAQFGSDTPPPKRALPKLWIPEPAEGEFVAPIDSRDPATTAPTTHRPSPVVSDFSPSASTTGLPSGTAERTYVALPGPRAKKAVVAAVARVTPHGLTSSTQTPSVRYSATIKELPREDRPRERLIALGPQALTTAELVAILIQSGTAERSSVSLGEHLLAHFGSVSEVAGASIDHLATVKGIGSAKASQIKAAIEFGKRVSLFSTGERTAIGGPSDVVNLLMSDLRYLKKEVLKSILLDNKNRVLAVHTVSIGDLTSSIVHPREVYKDAVIASAASIILAHNHPSGDPSPSADDVNVTKRLVSSGEILGIELLDHIVIGDGTFVSLKERGLF